MTTLRELAVDAAAHTPLWPGIERIDDPRFCVLFLEHMTFVQRLRLGEDEIDGAIDDVRALAAERGRGRTLWWVGDGAEPADLVPRLRARGLVPFGDETLAAMALEGEPRATGTVPIHTVESLDDYRTALAIEAETLGHPVDEDFAVHKWRLLDGSTELRHHLAIVAGEPVAMGRSAFGEAVFLMGGATLPRARRRGAYTALIAARHRDGGSRPLVAQASSESRPILVRLGFRQVGEIHVLADEGRR